jgi:hypothetical protein
MWQLNITSDLCKIAIVRMMALTWDMFVIKRILNKPKSYLWNLICHLLVSFETKMHLLMSFPTATVGRKWNLDKVSWRKKLQINIGLIDLAKLLYLPSLMSSTILQFLLCVALRVTKDDISASSVTILSAYPECKTKNSLLSV